MTKRYNPWEKPKCSPKLLAANKRTIFKKPLPESRVERKAELERLMEGRSRENKSYLNVK